jgi:UDP-glucose 4-epimerase
LRRQKLIYISSGGTVYGQSESLPINENHINKPISPYGLTKLTLENYARFYSVTEGLNYCIVRPSNAYGEGQAPFKGQGFIATVIASILKGVPVNIYGSTNVLRDYLYVSDLAYGIFKVLEYGKFGEVYNIGTGIGLSNLDIILKIQNIIGDTAQPAQFNHYPIRPFDVESNYLDCNKIKAHTGWEPKISIDEGLIKTINWLKENYARF